MIGAGWFGPWAAAQAEVAEAEVEAAITTLIECDLPRAVTGSIEPGCELEVRVRFSWRALDEEVEERDLVVDDATCATETATSVRSRFIAIGVRWHDAVRGLWSLVQARVIDDLTRALIAHPPIDEPTPVAYYRAWVGMDLYPDEHSASPFAGLVVRGRR